jgi:hypothetical protein
MPKPKMTLGNPIGPNHIAVREVESGLDCLTII